MSSTPLKGLFNRPGYVDVLGGMCIYSGMPALYAAVDTHPFEREHEPTLRELQFGGVHAFEVQFGHWQGGTVWTSFELLEGLNFWCLTSGVDHVWGVDRFLDARCAYSMGVKMVADLAPQSAASGYPASLGSFSVDQWRAMRHLIPDSVTGAKFLEQFGELGDTLIEVALEKTYKVRFAAEHHIYEGDRIGRFKELLDAAEQNPKVRHLFLRAAGDLLIQSHFSLDHRCNLGAPETDLIMNLAREVGPERGIYRARVAGRGAGGNVVLMTDTVQNSSVGDEVEKIAATYRERTGHDCQVIPPLAEGLN